MTEFKQNFAHVRGDSREVTIPVVDGDGDPEDLTDGTVRWQLRHKDDATSPVLITKTSAAATASLVRVNGVVGELDAIRFTLLPADTLALEVAHYDHEAEFIDVLGNVATVSRGIMEIKRDIVI